MKVYNIIKNKVDSTLINKSFNELRDVNLKNLGYCYLLDMSNKLYQNRTYTLIDVSEKENGIKYAYFADVTSKSDLLDSIFCVTSEMDVGEENPAKEELFKNIGRQYTIKDECLFGDETQNYFDRFQNLGLVCRLPLNRNKGDEFEIMIHKKLRYHMICLAEFSGMKVKEVYNERGALDLKKELLDKSDCFVKSNGIFNGTSFVYACKEYFDTEKEQQK
ncbi:MAG: hypothetical protein IJ301_04100 [Clostridia bacterium]|nr:hypothetical protein [Clostridia bacterium]